MQTPLDNNIFGTHQVVCKQAAHNDRHFGHSVHIDIVEKWQQGQIFINL